MPGGGEDKTGPGYTVILLGLLRNWLVEDLSQTGANSPWGLFFQPPECCNMLSYPQGKVLRGPAEGTTVYSPSVEVAGTPSYFSRERATQSDRSFMRGALAGLNGCKRTPPREGIASASVKPWWEYNSPVAVLAHVKKTPCTEHRHTYFGSHRRLYAYYPSTIRFQASCMKGKVGRARKEPVGVKTFEGGVHFLVFEQYIFAPLSEQRTPRS